MVERLSFCKLLMKMDYLKSFTMGSIKIVFLIGTGSLSFVPLAE
jgi:hypothetical protein